MRLFWTFLQEQCCFLGLKVCSEDVRELFLWPPCENCEQWGWHLLNIRGLGQNLELMWDFWKWNQCLSFCRVCLIKQSNSLLNTAGFARQEYTNLAEIVFLSVISVQTKTFSVSNKQNIQSHLWLSSVVWIQSTLICLDLL